MRKFYFSERYKKILDGIVKNGAIKHAYIFSGQAGSFYRNAMDYFGDSMQCLEFAEQPCGKCVSCTQIANGNTVDRYIVDPDEKIQKETIAQIQEYIKYGPFQNRFLVVIIKNINAMTPQSANAFLKTLEEPPPGVVFLLGTDNVSEVLPTIKSRCQVFELPAVSDKVLYEILEQFEAEKKEEIIKKSFNNPALIKYYLDDQDGLEENEYQSYQEFKKTDALEKMSFAEILSGNKAHAKKVLLAWTKEIVEKLESLNQQEQKNLQKIIDILGSFKYNRNLRLTLESLFLSFS